MRGNEGWLFIGPLPSKYVTGLANANAAAVEALRDSRKLAGVLDLSVLESSGLDTGKVSVLKIIALFGVIKKLFPSIYRVDGVYTNLSATTAGVLKNFLILATARAFGKRCVFHYHGGGFRQFYLRSGIVTRKIARHVVAKADRLIVLDACYISQFRFNRRENIHVVINGVQGPPERIDIGHVMRERTEGRFVYLSNLIQAKGYLRAIDAVISLSKRRPVCLHLYGNIVSSPEDELCIETREDLEGYISAKGGDGIVTFHGPISGEAKHAALLAGRALLLPTKYRGEGVPLCVLEAFSYGMPVVATRHRALKTIVTDDVGCHIEGESIDDVERAMERVLERNCREWFFPCVRRWRDSYTIERYKNDLVSVLVSDNNEGDR